MLWNHGISVAFLKLYTVPQGRLSVAYCIKMWCMLTTASRSTRHSAVKLYRDVTQSDPKIDKLFLRPSTALAAVMFKRVSCCHAVLLSAMFSAKYMRNTLSYWRVWWGRLKSFRPERRTDALWRHCFGLKWRLNSLDI